MRQKVTFEKYIILVTEYNLGSAERPRIGRAEVKDEKTDDSDTDAELELLEDGTDNAVPVNLTDEGLSLEVLSKFEKLLTNITQSMGDGKNITDEVYIEWGKSLESIIEIGNKTMNILPVVEVTNDYILPVSTGDETADDTVDEKAKEKKSEAKIETSTVMFIPSTRGGLLTSMMRERETEMSRITKFKVKMLESEGIQLARLFSTDLAKGQPCAGFHLGFEC